MRKDSGFTLIELLVTITVLAILVGVGIPSMLDFVENNRRAAAVNAVVADIQQGRSMAATSGAQVVLCHSSNGSDCSGADDPDWSDGWLLFVDDDQDVVQEGSDANGAVDAGERVLTVSRGVEGMTMPSSNGLVAFPPGLTRVVIGATIAVCTDGADRWISIGPTGRPELQTDNATVSCP